MWPVHTWLPDAHVEAPTGGSVILAAIMLKMGGYGFLRFSLPITPDASRELDWLVIALSLIAVVYIGFVALVQQDMKKLIAYSSIAHMGFVTLGAFVVYDIVRNTGGHPGRRHGHRRRDGADDVARPDLRRAVPVRRCAVRPRAQPRDQRLRRRRSTRCRCSPRFMVLFALANSGLPGTSGFVGEFLVIIASFKANFWYAVLAAVTLILGACLHAVAGEARDVRRRLPIAHVARAAGSQWPRVHRARRARRRGAACSGVWPAPLLKIMQPTIQHLVTQAIATKLGKFDAHASTPQSGYAPAIAEIYLVAAICVILLVDVFVGEQPPRPDRDADPGGPRARGGAHRARTARSQPPHGAVRRHYVADSTRAYVLKLVGFLVVAVALLYSRTYLANRDILRGEYYVLALTALLGIFVLISANSLITVYLGVELLALSVYAMVAFDRDSGDRGRVGHEVLRAGRDRLRDAAVRHVDDLRADRARSTSRRSPCALQEPPVHPGSCSGSRSSWSASPSSSAPCRSTCGCRTCTRARRPA